VNELSTFVVECVNLLLCRAGRSGRVKYPRSSACYQYYRYDEQALGRTRFYVHLRARLDCTQSLITTTLRSGHVTVLITSMSSALTFAWPSLTLTFLYLRPPPLRYVQ